MESDIPKEYGRNFMYTKPYFGKIGNDAVMIEKVINGSFVKYINNTGDIAQKEEDSELISKIEAFSYYTYFKSKGQLMVLELQGVGYQLCELEIASSTLFDKNKALFFCAGNLSGTAIATFFSQHKCNHFCRLLNLDLM
eukprot:gene10333-11408_t